MDKLSPDIFEACRRATEEALVKKVHKLTGSEKQWTPEICAEFSRVSLDDLLFNSYFLGSSLRREDMYPAVYETITEIWNWMNDPNRDPLHYVVLFWAIGGGKTTTNGVLQWLQWYFLTTHWFDFRKELHFLGNKPCALIQMNKDAKKARKVTFESIYPLFEQCAFNQEYFPIDKRVTSEIRISRNNILIFPGTGEAASVLGYDIYAAGLDEMAKMRTVDQSAYGANEDGKYDVGKDIFDQVDQRIQSRFGSKARGVMVMFTQRNTGREFIETFAKGIESGRIKNAMVKKYTFWDAVGRDNPKHFTNPKNVFIHTKNYTVIDDDAQIEILRQKKKELLLKENHATNSI